MIYTVLGSPYDSNHLYHHGISGQKWGRRRYQNFDGTLTPEGKLRYRKSGEVKFSQTKGAFRKTARAAVAVSSLGLDRPISRFQANHKKLMVAGGTAVTAMLGVASIALVGPEMLPAAVISTGASFVGSIVSSELNEAKYSYLYRNK